MFNQEELKAFWARVGDTDGKFDEKHGIPYGGHSFYCELSNAIDEERWDNIDQSDKFFALYAAAFAKEDVDAAPI